MREPHEEKVCRADPLAAAGMGTTPDMWCMVSEALHGVKLPASLNTAIYALCDGDAKVILSSPATTIAENSPG
jgi:hypothetical protein